MPIVCIVLSKNHLETDKSNHKIYDSESSAEPSDSASSTEPESRSKANKMTSMDRRKRLMFQGPDKDGTKMPESSGKPDMTTDIGYAGQATFANGNGKIY